MYLLVSFITLFFGSYVGKVIFKNKLGWSQVLIPAFWAPVIFMFLGNVLLSIPLSILAKIYFLTLIVGSTFLYFWTIKAFGFKWQIGLDFLLNPFVVLFAISCLGFLFWAPSNYLGSSWDEYSHWLLMPKQFFYFDHFFSKNFIDSTFVKYTPGWTLALVYPQLVLKDWTTMQFSSAELIYAPLILGLLSLAFVFDFFVCLARKIQFKYPKLISLSLLSCLVLLNILSGFSINVLIEDPQIYFSVVVFVGFWALAEDLVPSKPAYGFFSFLLLVAYLIKSPLISYLFLFSFMLLVFLKMKINNLILMALPTLICFGLWSWVTKDYESIFKNQYAITDLFKAIEAKALVVPELIDFYVWKIQDFEILFYFGFILFIYFSNKKSAVVARALVYNFLLFNLGLLLMYYLYFDYIEGAGATLNQRYASVPLTLMQVLAVVFIFQWTALEKFRPIFEKKIMKSVYGLLILVGFFTWCLGYKQIYMGKFSQPNVDYMAVETDKIRQFLDENKFSPEQTYLIYQGGNGQYLYQALYHSFGGPWPSLNLAKHYSWSPQKVDMWSEVVPAEDLLVKFGKAHVIWPLRTDAWIENRLRKLVKSETCSYSFVDVYLIRRPSETYFTCYKKKN